MHRVKVKSSEGPGLLSAPTSRGDVPIWIMEKPHLGQTAAPQRSVGRTQIVQRAWPEIGLAHGKSCHIYTHGTCSWGVGAASGPRPLRPPGPGLAAPLVAPLHTCLGLALEVEGQYVLPGPSLTLPDHKEAVVPGPACQHQLRCSDPRECPVEPGVVGELQLWCCLGLRLGSLLPWRG